MAGSRPVPNCSNSVPSQAFLSWLLTKVMRMMLGGYAFCSRSSNLAGRRDLACAGA